MKELEKENQKFYRNCGEILRIGFLVESYLDFFISNYFVTPQTYKTFLFTDLILAGLPNFGLKCSSSFLKESFFNLIKNKFD